MSGKPFRYVVGLLGVSGSGKSVVARRLYEHHGLTRIRFGEPQRDMLRSGFGLTDAEIDGPDRLRPNDRLGGHTPQHLIHTLSHVWGRASIHSNLWVNEWSRRVGMVEGGVLADDIQRPNEADATRTAGGVVIRVTRRDYTPTNPQALQRLSMIQHDAEIINTGDLEELVVRTDEFVVQLNRALAQLAA